MTTALTITNLDCYAGPDWLASLLLKTSRPGSASGFKKSKNKLYSSAGPTGAYGINCMYAELLTIATASNTTITLSAFTDIFSQTSVAMARLKFYAFWLISNDDRSDLVPTDTTVVTIGAAGSNPHPLNLGDAASDTLKLLPGDIAHYWTPSPLGITVTASSADQVKFANAGSGYSAKLAVVMAGSLT